MSTGDNMRHLLLTATAFTLLLASGSASASYVHQDFATSGDNLTTLDQSTGIEWLKLSATKGMNLEQVSAKMGSGGLFDGWHFPTGDEVEALISRLIPLSFNNTQPDSASTLTSTFHYGAYATSWYTWMGKPDYGSGYNISYGLHYQEVNGTNKILMTGVRNANTKVYIYEDYYSPEYSSTFIGGDSYGVFLVKNDIPTTTPPLVSDVPAPLASWVIGLGAILFGYRRKCKKTDTLTSN